MQNNTIKAIFLPENIRDRLNVTPYDYVDIVEENNEIKLKNKWEHFTEEMGDLIHDDFTELGVVDDKTAIEYVQKFRDEKSKNCTD